MQVYTATRACRMKLAGPSQDILCHEKHSTLPTTTCISLHQAQGSRAVSLVIADVHFNLPQGNKVSMLTRTYPHKPLGRLK